VGLCVCVGRVLRGKWPIFLLCGFKPPAKMSVDQFVGVLSASAQRLAAGFETASQADFVWLTELEQQLVQSHSSGHHSEPAM
jgi:hypothetical protein